MQQFQTGFIKTETSYTWRYTYKKQWNGNSVFCPILTVVWFSFFISFLSNFFSPSGHYSSFAFSDTTFRRPYLTYSYQRIPLLHDYSKLFLALWYITKRGNTWKHTMLYGDAYGSSAQIRVLKKMRKSSAKLNIDTHKAQELAISVTVRALRLLFSIPLLLIFL